MLFSLWFYCKNIIPENQAKKGKNFANLVILPKFQKVLSGNVVMDWMKKDLIF